MLNEGRTSQALILRGLMGIGKGTFAEMVAMLVGNDYATKTANIKNLQNRFNSDVEDKILMVVEEVPLNASSYHEIMELIKDLIDTPTVRVEKKGIDPYHINNTINYIFNTNNVNPMKMPKYNRRFLCLDVNASRMNDYEYFKTVRNQVSQNIEYLRYYYYSYEYNPNLNSIRPTTKAEEDMFEITQDPVESFIDTLFKNLEYELDELYNDFQRYCYNDNIKVNVKKKLFKSILKMNGYGIKRTQRDGENVYIIKYNNK